MWKRICFNYAQLDVTEIPYREEFDLVGAFGGGLVGKNYGTIEHCYSTGFVSDNAVRGGLVGSKNSGTVINSYYDADTSGQNDTGKGIPRSTFVMQFLEPCELIYTDWS